LGKVQDGHFAVLVLDADSTRIMSAACRVSELLNFRVSRKPSSVLRLPQGIPWIQVLNKHSFGKFCEEMSCLCIQLCCMLPSMRTWYKTWCQICLKTVLTMVLCACMCVYCIEMPLIFHIRDGAVVDDLFKRREPQRSAAGVYFLTPSPASVARLLEDWQAPLRDGRGGPTYASAHVYFTSKLPPQLLASLRGCPGLVARLKALAEVGAHLCSAWDHSVWHIICCNPFDTLSTERHGPG
jgi:hypothetical protein